MIASCFHTSFVVAQNIVHDVLQFKKVSVRWMLRQLTAEMKVRCVDSCEELCALFFVVEGYDFLQRLSPKMKPGSFTTNPKSRKRARNIVIAPHQIPSKFHTRLSARRARTISFRMNEESFWRTTVEAITGAVYADLIRNQVHHVYRCFVAI